VGARSAVVSGEVTPDKFVVNKITGEISKRDISRKTVQHVPDADEGKVIEVAVPVHLQTAPCVSDDEIRALTMMAKAIEQHYGQARISNGLSTGAAVTAIRSSCFNHDQRRSGAIAARRRGRSTTLEQIRWRTCCEH